MTLIRPKISDFFKNSAKGSPDHLTVLTDVGMVGASVSSWKEVPDRTPRDYILQPSEEPFLNASNRNLNQHGYRIHPDADVCVSELKKKSDFLKGAFDNVNIDFLVLSSIYFNPNRSPNAGNNTMQSPLAADPENWIKKFQDISALAILNIWKFRDQESGEAISEFIQSTKMYKSVYRVSCGLVMQGKDTDLYLPEDNGGELFLKMP